MKTLFPVLFTDALAECRDFYVSVFDFEVVFNIEWYVHLKSPAAEGWQIAFVARDHYSVPERFHAAAAGVAITLEFDEVDPVYARVVELGIPVHVELRDEAWGQRHFVIEDPSGSMVDVVQPIEPTEDFLVTHGLSEA